LENHVNDTVSLTWLCGLTMDDPVPDHSIVSQFWTMLTTQNAWHRLQDEVNDQLQDEQTTNWQLVSRL
jgi:transposase, IS5 family